MHKHTHTHPHTLIYCLTQTDTRRHSINTCKHTPTHIHTHTDTNTHTHTHKHTHTNTQTQTNAHTHTHKHKHYTQTRIHTHKHTRTHTHARTHTLKVQRLVKGVLGGLLTQRPGAMSSVRTTGLETHRTTICCNGMNSRSPDRRRLRVVSGQTIKEREQNMRQARSKKWEQGESKERSRSVERQNEKTKHMKSRAAYPHKTIYACQHVCSL